MWNNANLELNVEYLIGGLDRGCPHVAVDFKKCSCRPVGFKKCPCPMSLSLIFLMSHDTKAQNAHGAMSILGVHPHLIVTSEI